MGPLVPPLEHGVAPRGVLPVRVPPGQGVCLAAGAQGPAEGAGRRGSGAVGGGGGRGPWAGVTLASGGDEVGAGARHPALQVVGLGAPQGRGGAEVAQVVGTVDHGLLPAPQRQDGPLGVPVAGLAWGRGEPGAGRQRRGGRQGLQAGDPVGAEEVRPGGTELLAEEILFRRHGIACYPSYVVYGET